MLRYFCCLIAAGSSLLTATARGQNTFFDVAVIRQNTSPVWDMGMSLRGGSLQVTNLFLKSLITSAYGVREGLIFGLPGWAESARFDIRARVTDADPAAFDGMSREQRRGMMAALLEDRFHLKVHTATRMLPVYQLVVVRDRPKFSESGQKDGGAARKVDVHRNEFTATDAAISTLCSVLEEVTGRTVIDQTSLKGFYDFHLKWTEDLGAATDADALPSIFTALQEQLGVKLQPDKGPVETLLVDHIERPSEN